MASTIKPTTVRSYIRTFPRVIQDRLMELHACILEAAPGAKEELKWGMPAYSYEKILVMFGGFRNHTGFFPGPSVMQAFSAELSKFKHSNATVQFPHNKPLPRALVKKMVKFRVKEHKAGTITWKN